MDAFISHSSQDVVLARQVEAALAEEGLEAWLDDSDIRLGALLRDELQDQIKACRVLVLLWSEAASRSRWIAAELLTAFHLNRYTVPCVLDDTPLPHYLQKAVHLDLRPSKQPHWKALCRAVRNAPSTANRTPAVFSSASAALVEEYREIARLQAQETGYLTKRKVKEAAEVHAQLEPRQQKAEARWPLESKILNLAGYHSKNAYLIQHWDAIQAGRPPQDPLLREAERFFFETQFVDPFDYSALDGLGSVLMLESELDAAEFFFERAIALAEADGIDYAAAKQNLALIRQHKRRRNLAAEPGPVSGTAASVPGSSEKAEPAVPGGADKVPSGAPSSLQKLLQEAQSMLINGQFQQALGTYEAVLDEEPSSAQAHLGRGRCLIYLNRLDEALRALETAVSFEPDNREALSARAATLVGLGRHADGLEQIHDILSRWPDYSEPKYNAACTFCLLKDADEACRWLELAVRDDGTYARLARSDPHFAYLRNHPQAAPRFWKIVS